MLVVRCLMTSTYKKNGEGCFIRDVQPKWMYFAMAINDVTTDAPKIFNVFFFEEDGVFFFCFISLTVYIGRYFAA